MNISFSTETPPIDTTHRPEFSVAQISETGHKPQNEDSVGFYIPDEPLLAIKGAVTIIADGVSSAEAGKEASNQCVNEFIREFYNTPEMWSTSTAAQKVLTVINRSLYRRSNEFTHQDKGHITTLSILVIKSNRAHLFHIGDSRIYRLRNDQLEQLTQDHLSTANSESPYLVRAMGMDIRLKMDYRCIEVEENDLFFMSTDGIHDFVNEKKIVDALLSCGEDFQFACSTLVKDALKGNSEDNLSCLALRINQLPLETPQQANNRLTLYPFPPDLESGMKLDGYQINKLFFASKRSQLYHVTDEVTGNDLVMKTPSITYSDDPAYIEGFLTEAWAGSRFDHPNIVKVIPHHGQRQFLYYLMEYIEGITLERWMQKNKRPKPSVVIAIIKQIAAGLNALHERETIHQDLKPGNIMITSDGAVKIIDLGSVYVAGIAEIFTPIKRGAILGTVNYTDPLCMLGKHTGVKGDIFSLASITYEMLTGKLPYGHRLENFSSSLDEHSLKYIPSSHINKSIPIWLDATLHKATDIHLDNRYAAIDDFIHDLENPNPDFLTEAFIIQHQKRFPTFKIWQLLGFLWFISLLFAVMVFI